MSPLEGGGLPPSDKDTDVVGVLTPKKMSQVLGTSDPGDEDEDETGDPDKLPGDGAEKEIQPDFLVPFNFGWRREVVFRQARRAGIPNCDIYYIPPQDGCYHTRKAQRKRRSKKDQERYFQDFPDDDLSVENFDYFKKPLGLNNAAYEVVRQAKLQDAFVKDEALDHNNAPPHTDLYKGSKLLLRFPHQFDRQNVNRFEQF